MKKVRVEGSETAIEIDHKDGTLIINGESASPDISQISANHFHVLHKGKSISIRVLEINRKDAQLRMEVNGKVQTITVQNELALLLEKMGIDKGSSQKIDNIKAPMPGLVLDIKVEAGAEINEGDALIVLEAMKMENILKSPGAGVIKEIKVNAGDAVDKGAVLIEME